MEAAMEAADGAEIISYIDSRKNPVATILPTILVSKQEPAPIMEGRGSSLPEVDTRRLLKETKIALEGRNPPKFHILSGTSMESPHVLGIAAEVKSRNPTRSPSAIKSVIMTTAVQTNYLGALITTEDGTVATNYDYGAGEVTTTGPLQPRLVYETTTFTENSTALSYQVRFDSQRENGTTLSYQVRFELAASLLKEDKSSKFILDDNDSLNGIDDISELHVYFDS
ncbi:hypothetical protein ACFE04_014783 [Oxalis oulophora]